MNMDEQRAYELEMAQETDEREQTPEQRRMVAQRNHATILESERLEAVRARRASGVDDRLTLSHGIYEGQRDAKGNETFDRSVEMPQSDNRVYFNIARQITNDGAAQLGDLLFPNDDRNYGLNPGPVAKPPLALQAERAVDSKGKALLDEQGQPLTNIQAHNRRVARVQAKTKRMFEKVDAALIKARYPSKSRKTIFNAACYGTGILKGPVPQNDKRGRWAKKADKSYGRRMSEEKQADVTIVSPFDFFPDMSCSDVNECGYIWERTYMLPAALESAPGFRKEAVKRILAQKPVREETETEDVREEAKTVQTGQQMSDGRYVVWERRGTIERELLADFDVTIPGNDRFYDAIVYMCDGEILRVVVNKFENKDPIYSVFCWDDDPLGIFGYGIPWLIRDPQATYVAAWRMALDNGGISAMPQVVIDRMQVTPADGKEELRGGKLWYRSGESFSNENQRPAFEVHNINQNLGELWAMMDRAVDDSYELSGVTRVEKAQGGLDNAPVTLGATQILQNNTTVSRRALARRWDDDVTLGLITRMYDFFMQFDKDDDIKAHMVVEPRGASVLLAKELQASNLMQLYQMTGGGQAEGVKSVELLRGIAGVMQVPEGKFIETQDEYDTRIAAEQEQGRQPSIEEQLAMREADVAEANVELAQGRFNLDTAVAEHKQALEWAEFEFKQLVESAKLDDNRQARADKLMETVTALREKQAAEMEKIVVIENNKRATAVDKIVAERPAKEASAMAALQNADRADRELEYKMTTGNEGI